MKVCRREIYAHSNILAAASPYFNSFLRQELPRHFSQRTPQIIEIQIDGNEPKVVYEEAVSSVIDFIYTGEMVIKDSNVSPICEIARIMKMDTILSYCTDFRLGKAPTQVEEQAACASTALSSDVSQLPGSDILVSEDLHGEGNNLPLQPPQTYGPITKPTGRQTKGKAEVSAFHSKIKANQLLSVAIQVYPHMLPEKSQPRQHDLMQDQATSTDSRYFESLNVTRASASKKVIHKKKAKASPQKTLRYILHSPDLLHSDKGSPDENSLVPLHSDKETLEENSSVFCPGNENNEDVICDVDDTEIHTFAETNNSENINDAAEESGETKDPDPEDCSQTDKKDEEPPSVENDGKLAEATEADDSVQIIDELSLHTPRRSSRVSKPTAKLQELQHVKSERSNGSLAKPPPLKKVKLEKRDDERNPETYWAKLNEEFIDHGDGENKNFSESIEDRDNELPMKQEYTDDVEAAERLLSLADEFVHSAEHESDEEYVVEEYTAEDADNIIQVAEDVAMAGLSGRKRKRTSHGKLADKRLATVHSASGTIGPGKYQCDSCDFNTNKVRDMSAHIKLHKLEHNTCYYCEAVFENKDVLTQHMEKHKGPNPFYCHVCEQRFKSRTILNMHLPKHSDNKPFICEICCAGFKWKHALKCHMITHSNKKEHLCDTCGFATAHKSQLKAHRKIHTGDTYKCEYAGCDFEATKLQNLKYHLLTHTKEKPHQCDMCGQNFSLVKNLRRHMRLHGPEKDVKCKHCAFTSTRMDKLKEHLLKVHAIGTPPERRVRTTDLVHHREQRLWTVIPVANEEEIRNTDPGLIKMEGIQEVEEQTIEAHPMTTEVVELEEGLTVEQLAQTMTHNQGDEEGTTLIEIGQDGTIVQPIHIFPEQSILIAQGSHGSAVLQDAQFGEVVQLGHNIVMAEPDNSINTLESEENIITSSSSGTLGQVEMVALVPQNAANFVETGDSVITVKGITASSLAMTTTDDKMECTNIVEVPVSQVATFVQSENSGASD